MHAHYTWAEVVPLAALLVVLAEWCAFIFIIGICFVVGAFVTAILGTLAGFSVHIPFIGNPIASAIHKAEHAITNALGNVERKFDHRAGGALHEMARIVDWTYREIARHANLIETIAGMLLGQGVVGALRYGISVLHGRVDATTAQLRHALHRVETLEQRLAHSITAGVLPRLGRLEREYDHIIDKDIAGLRSRARTVEQSLTDLWDYVRTHPWTIATEAFVGAVAIALTRLGFDWIKCPGVNRIGKGICALPLGLLDDLLAESILAFAALDLCDFANAAQSLAQQFTPELMALVDVEDALVGCHGATAPPALPLPRLRLPPNSLSLDLAA